MKSAVPISVFIIAKDEEDRIPYTISSVIEWVDEVLVIDSGSQDKTVEIAAKLGAKVLYHEWQGYGPQKIFAESVCRHDWLLNIDADEAVTPALRDEIIALFSQGKEPEIKAWRFDIRILSRFAHKPSRFAPSNDPVRFYHKSYAGFKSSTVHDSVVFKADKKGAIGKFKYPVEHRCFRSFSHAVEKINRYTQMQAEDMVARGRIPGVLRVISEPFFAFVKAYVLRRYCLLGLDGFYESVIYAFARTLRFAKAHELYRLKKQP
jgi:glycosyltransferase involved in cell wall biosynthesis